MRFPEIREAIFDPDTDSAGNSEMLRKIFEYMGVEYKRLTDEFTARETFKVWGIRIEDKHDDEEEPHYVLEVGELDYRNCHSRRYTTRYVDYHSRFVSRKPDVLAALSGKRIDPSVGVITTAPGEYTIQVWIDAETSKLDSLGRTFSQEYLRIMNETLPSYCVLAAKEVFAHPLA